VIGRYGSTPVSRIDLPREREGDAIRTISVIDRSPVHPDPCPWFGLGYARGPGTFLSPHPAAGERRHAIALVTISDASLN
jgi:hypothetical protein